jgi:hypothetical protein
MLLSELCTGEPAKTVHFVRQKPNLFVTNDPQKRFGKTDLIPCGLALAAQAKPYGIRRPSIVVRFSRRNPRAVYRPDLAEKPAIAYGSRFTESVCS